MNQKKSKAVEELFTRIKKIRKKDPGYGSTLLTALLVVGEKELLAAMNEAEEKNMKIDVTYPIPPEQGPSDPSGIVLVPLEGS